MKNIAYLFVFVCILVSYSNAAESLEDIEIPPDLVESVNKYNEAAMKYNEAQLKYYFKPQKTVSSDDISRRDR